MSFKSSAALVRLAPLSGEAADGQQCRGYEEVVQGGMRLHASRKRFWDRPLRSCASPLLCDPCSMLEARG